MSKWVGEKLSLEIYGESHDEKIGFVAQGLPKIKVNKTKLNKFIKERSGGSGLGVTERKENDEPVFIQGFEEGSIKADTVECVIYNKDVESKDYDNLYGKPRPSHADWPLYAKEGTLDFKGGGRFSARRTALFVVVGGILEQFFEKKGIRTYAYISQIGNIRAASYKEGMVDEDEYKKITKKDNIVALSSHEELENEIVKAALNDDSVGISIDLVVFGVSAGLGDAYFQGLESKLAYLLYSIPGVKGVEFGSGFDFVGMRGSFANDSLYYDMDGNVKTLTNHSGGINGGITNGMPLTMRVAFRPTSSIGIMQETVDLVNKENTTIKIEGRHDTCIGLRALNIVKSMFYMGLYDSGDFK